MEEIAARNKEGKLFTEQELLTVIRDICEALSVLHHYQPPIAHRDIKGECVNIAPHTHADSLSPQLKMC